MNGILLVDKPKGWTSHDVVAKVRSLLRQQAQSQKLKAKSPSEKLSAKNFQLLARGSKIRVGHAGTLDPAATGLLILLVGSYTKRAGEFSKLDKTYEAELTLGKTSTTGDAEGQITKESIHRPSKTAIQTVLNKFVGEIAQTPHPYSAVKVGGQRAYKLARKGQEVKLEARKVVIYDIKLQNYDYPTVSFTTKVSSGTYIRSLAEDIGEKLGTGAYLSSLRRTRIGKFDIKQALKNDETSLSEVQYLP